jgi:gluconolactonase
VAPTLTIDAGPFELVAEGIGFPEGPVWVSDGSILVVEQRDCRLTRITPAGAIEPIADIAGCPNGAAIGPDGAVYIANNGGMAIDTAPDGRMTVSGTHAHSGQGGSIDRVDLATGKVTTLYRECDGQKIGAPNDLVFDHNGGFYFTDVGAINDVGIGWGALYYALADGSRIVRAHRGRWLISPNGVGLSADERTLYTAETFTGRVWAYTIARPGEFAVVNGGYARRPLGELPHFEALDSLAVDSRGRVCVGPLVGGGVAVFDPDSGGTAIVPAPDDMITNVCFGGPDMQDVWITAGASGKLYKGRWDCPGLRLAHYA